MTTLTRSLLAMLLFSSAMWVGDARAEPITLSVDEALALFYQRNLELIAAQYNVDQARADEIIAAAIPNPTLGLQVGELAGNLNKGSSATGCNHNPASSCGPAEFISFSQLIEMAGKRGLRMESSGFATQAAESDFKDAVRIFSNLVVNAYYSLLQAQKDRWLAQEIVDHYQDIGKANALRLKGGDIAESDFLRVKMEALRAQSDLDNAQSTLIKAQADFATVLRWPDNGMQFEAREIWPNGVDVDQQAGDEQLIDQALHNRPDLLGDKQRKAQAEKELELARRLKYPDVTVNAGYARDPSNNALNSAFVGISVPVPLFYQYQGESDKAAVKLNQNLLAVEQTELAIRSDVVKALAAWRSSQKIVQRFKDGLLDDAATVRKSAELAYSKGATSVLDFIEAQRSYKNVMHDYAVALINRANAYYDLSKALGSEIAANRPATNTVPTLKP